ncbi:hypothetical protein GCM10027578_05940 [Spirosoma luteolum]
MLSLDTQTVGGYLAAVDPVPAAALGPDSWYARRGKRLFDVLVALLVTITVLSWLVPVVGLFIRIGSPGPIFFRQRRSGKFGQVFWCLKFRSMYYRPTQFAQATQNDARVTPIGRFLRKTNLDEMPQFINVLLGDMSIVGPRPHAIEHDDRYWFTLPNYHLRYHVRPGVTGLAQVRGARGETDKLAKMKHRVTYDQLYVKRQSFGVDMKICFMTVGAMLKGNVNAW